MKNIRLMSLATMLVALFMSVGTFAQDVNLSVDKCYLKPGSPAQITVKIEGKNTTFSSLYADITLPEGISFVKGGKTDAEGQFNYTFTKTKLSKDAFVVFVGNKDNEASLSIVNDNDFTDCEGDFFVFDVNVANDFAEVGDITFSNVTAKYFDYDNKTWKTWEIDKFTAKAYNEDELYTPSVNDFKIAKDSTKAIAFGFNFEKPVANMSFNVELPEGLTIDGYTPSEERIPHHFIGVKKSGRVTILPDGSSDDLNFVGTEGTLFTFDVTANEDFKGGEIKFYNLEALTQADENGINTTYYAKDFTVKVDVEEIITGINGIETIGEGAADGIYQLNGVRTDKLQRGVNIVVKDGKAIKVVKK